LKAVLVGNGLPPPPELFRKLAADATLLVAADGGANHFYRLGLSPHLVVGDLDSISTEVQKAFEKTAEFIVHPKDKDKMDMELALDECLRRGISQVSVFSWKSTDFDYSLTNLYLFSRFQGKIDLIDDQSLGFILSSHRPFLELSGQRVGQRVSIFPLKPRTSLTTQGLRWNLSWRNESPPTTSQSNETLEARFECALEGGCAAVFVGQDAR
jgi:thiamine pyrophosphokinase